MFGDEADRQHRAAGRLDVGYEVGVAVNRDTLVVHHGITAANGQDDGLCAQDGRDLAGPGVPLGGATQSVDDGRNGGKRTAPLDLGACVDFAVYAVDLEDLRTDGHSDDPVGNSISGGDSGISRYCGSG